MTVTPGPPAATPDPRVVVDARINYVDLGTLTTSCTVVYEDGSTQTIQWPIAIETVTASEHVLPLEAIGTPPGGPPPPAAATVSP